MSSEFSIIQTGETAQKLHKLIVLVTKLDRQAYSFHFRSVLDGKKCCPSASYQNNQES
jgi:hypothetical protein